MKRRGVAYNGGILDGKGDLPLRRYLKKVIPWLTLFVVLASCQAPGETKTASLEVNETQVNSSEENVTSDDPTTPSVKTAAIEEQVDEIMANAKFSGSILIVQDDQIVVSKGYGYSDYSAGQFNGPETIHQIGSLTKAFTAASILQLQEAGLLDLQDPVQTYIEDFLPQFGEI